MRAGKTYDAAADFSATSRPHGFWSYGQEATLGGSLSLYTVHNKSGGVDDWGTGSFLAPPEVFHDGTNQVGHGSTITLQPGRLAFHPGPQDQYSILRFTSPTPGVFTLNSAFIGADPTTTDVHVLLDGASLFGGEVGGYGNGPIFSTTLTLKAGDTVDLAVGYGNNGTYFKRQHRDLGDPRQHGLCPRADRDRTSGARIGGYLDFHPASPALHRNRAMGDSLLI